MHTRRYPQLCAAYATVATSSCRTGVGRACSRANLNPLRPPRRSLECNDLSDETEQSVTDAAGSGVSVKF